MITVFIPTTPNPTSGFLTLFKKSDITFLDMKIEDAFKYVISCGVLNSDPCATSPFIHPQS
ncbi:putative inner membrane protein [Chlamydia trachomatis]|nr:putative inner membrane protein [Chlamydia trachomatis]